MALAPRDGVPSERFAAKTAGSFAAHSFLAGLHAGDLAIGEFPGHGMGIEVGAGVDFGAAFDHGDIDTGAGEMGGKRASGGTRTDNNYVIDFHRFNQDLMVFDTNSDASCCTK